MKFHLLLGNVFKVNKSSFYKPWLIFFLRNQPRIPAKIELISFAKILPGLDFDEINSPAQCNVHPKKLISVNEIWWKNTLKDNIFQCIYYLLYRGSFAFKNKCCTF